MNLIELNGALRQLRLSGMAGTLETRLLQAQTEAMAPIDLISILVSDELSCRSERLLERRHKQARFRDANKTLDTFDFQFNPKMNRALHRRRRTAGNHHASLRAHKHIAYVEQTRRGLG
jgi:DNA replication protein DnaC